ncbi:protein-disulfide reductase DsbD family protein [Tranquillimonas alkanivorans]|uniref:Suppressor for copper-sensitivity B n=1 Tax=Tranquillimonas alkanivorans TaxID=441119 RepID=A0A1I5V5G3_9RHOB|nr:protein-disulfide reductase DsbD domain-containing protein [Tranquillimonas alkanivorans]SFQ02691.1 suppressor for copper-sensitivity B [Tranquillimonas alkanivorans]
MKQVVLGGLRKSLWPARATLAVLLAFPIAGSHPASAAVSDTASTAAVTAKLIVAEEGVVPGAQSLSAGLELQLEEGWKTYWRTPGDVGFPPEVDWSESSNVEDVEFQWPAPERFTAFGIENFGYHGEVVFPLRIALEEPGQPARLEAHVRLLTCSDICVPQEFDLALEVPVGTGLDARSAARIAEFAKRVPVIQSASAVTEAEAYIDGKTTELVVSVRSNVPFDRPDVFPELGAGVSLGAPDIRMGEGGRLLWARVPILAAPAGPLSEMSVTVTDEGARAVTLSPDRAMAAPPAPFATSSAAPDAADLFWIAMTALLGGLILNVMPCVLPVLSIKLSAALKLEGTARAKVRRGFLASAAGVMAFMWGLAAVLYALQRLGVTVGWGVQFQNPVFLALMIVLLAIFAANLAGLFEIRLPSGLQTRLAQAGASGGHAGDFLTGAFGAVLATPCSAPFLGTAIAFALAGRGLDIVIVFTFLGFGLAAPYLLIAAAPGLVRHMPRPGRWMLVVKGLLALLLAATAAWLVWVLSGVAGATSARLVTGASVALILTLGLPRLPRPARLGLASALAVLPLVLAGAFADGGAGGARDSAATDGIPWIAFDRAGIAQRVSRGEIVFVDVTADWCLTCKANKALVLEREPVAPALAGEGVTAMQADWTQPDEAISRYLESFDRFGIPFNAVYGPQAPGGVVLPELLSLEAVMTALDQAGGAGRVGKGS